MRSGYFWSLSMKDKLKCKRHHVHWKDKLLNLENEDIWLDFFMFRKAHPGMSEDRCAYNVLKRRYSTTALDYVRMFDCEFEDVPHLVRGSL